MCGLLVVVIGVFVVVVGFGYCCLGFGVDVGIVVVGELLGVIGYVGFWNGC